MMDIHSLPILNEHSTIDKKNLFVLLRIHSFVFLLHIEFVFLFDELYKHNKLSMIDVHLNDEEQYVYSMQSMLNNMYKLNRVEHHLEKNIFK